MKPPPGSEMPLVLVKWYAYAKWLLKPVAGWPSITKKPATGAALQ